MYTAMHVHVYMIRLPIDLQESSRVKLRGRGRKYYFTPPASRTSNRQLASCWLQVISRTEINKKFLSFLYTNFYIKYPTFAFLQISLGRSLHVKCNETFIVTFYM